MSLGFHRRALRWAAVLLLWPTLAFGEANNNDLNLAFNDGKWDAAAQIAHEIIQRDPTNTEAALKGAYALFQKGLANSALVFIKKLTLDQWRRAPQGQDRFAEIVSLFQKKVPLSVLPGRLDQVSESEVPPYLRDEVLFAKGRASYEAHKPTARAYLEAVSPNSRFFMEAHYLLACLAVEKSDYDTASLEIGKIFQPQLFAQASEFWRDIGTQMTSHWGANLKVFLDATLLNQSRVVGELGNLATARLRYAKHEYELAVEQYKKVPVESPLAMRAKLETIWALLQLNRHDLAREEAVNLSSNEAFFESIEARILQAVILADSHRGPEARQVLDAFEKVYETHMANLGKYRDFGVSKSLPAFTQTDIKSDKRISQIEEYMAGLKAETAQLRSNSERLFPVYRALAAQLELLSMEGKAAIQQITKERVESRLKDLDALYVQGRLVRAETYLEDREKMKEDFLKQPKITEEMQKGHDLQLVTLLTQVVDIIDPLFPKMRKRNPYLEFRHSELLWELGTARLILSQTTDKQKNEQLGELLRKKSLILAERIVEEFPEFKKRAQAMFFVGFSQLELNQENKGIATLERYVKENPNHVHTPDAYRILGDYYFDVNRFDRAEEYFVRILAFEDSPVIGYAYYKIAWCNYNRHNYAKALLGLEKAIVWANTSAQKGQLLSLKREAGGDLISVYAEVGDPKKAMEYFESFVGGNTHEWLQSLAGRYDEMGQYEKSTFVYNVLISLNDTGVGGLSNYAPIIRGHYKLAQWPDVLKASGELVSNYKKDLAEPQAKDSSAAGAEDAVRTVALAQHFEFGKSEELPVIERIIALDQLYLEAFGKWPESQPLLYEYGHFLGAKKRLSESAKAYKDHWAQFKSTLKEPIREEAIRNYLHSLEVLDVARVVDPKAEAAPPAPPEAEDLLNATKEYLSQYPKTKHSRAITFLQGTTLLKYGRLDDGIRVTQGIFDVDSKDNFGKEAFRNLKIAYYRKKDWAAANQWAALMLARPAAEMRAYAAELTTVKEETLFLWAGETKENPKAAELFLRLANDPAGTKLKDRALYNAIARYNEAQDKVKVLQLSRELETSAPKSEFIPQLSGIRGSILQEAGDYVQALGHFQGFLKRTDKDITPEVQQQARLNAALILQATDQATAAVALYKEYIEKAPDKATKGVAQANAGLKYLEAKSKRGLASTVWPEWASLEKMRRDFLIRPVPKQGDLGGRIKAGAARTEELMVKFTEAASAKETPEAYAFEALCAVPSLYKGLAAGIRDLANSVPKAARAEIAAELEKVAAPVDQKAGKWAADCLAKAADAEHEGTLQREVAGQWGWQADPAMRQKVASVQQLLESRAPWVWPASDGRTESGLIDKHLKQGGDPTSWYALGRSRLAAKRWGLARLTLLDTLARLEAAPPAPKIEDNDKDKERAKDQQPVSVAPVTEAGTKGAVLNALAFIEWQTLKPKGVTELFERAAQEGSRYAWVNIALVHLQSGRWEQAKTALRRAHSEGAFDRDPELKGQIAQVIQP